MFCDNSLTYEDMLEKIGQLRIRLNLLCLVAIDMIKCINDLNPLYINETFLVIIFEIKADYCNLNLTPKDMVTGFSNILVPKSGRTPTDLVHQRLSILKIDGVHIAKV